jgi:excisionase family DNA binding protein
MTVTQPATFDLPGYLTIQDAARFLGVSAVHLTRLSRTQDMGQARFGRTWRYKRTRLEEWAEAQRVFPTSEAL